MSRYAYATQLIEAHLERCGLSPEVAKSEAPRHLAVLIASGLINTLALETVERDARVYTLRGQRLTAVVIGQRVQLGRSQVFEAVRRHAGRRRAVLRLIA